MYLLERARERKNRRFPTKKEAYPTGNPFSLPEPRAVLVRLSASCSVPLCCQQAQLWPAVTVEVHVPARSLSSLQLNKGNRTYRAWQPIALLLMASKMVKTLVAGLRRKEGRGSASAFSTGITQASQDAMRCSTVPSAMLLPVICVSAALLPDLFRVPWISALDMDHLDTNIYLWYVVTAVELKPLNPPAVACCLFSL